MVDRLKGSFFMRHFAITFALGLAGCMGTIALSSQARGQYNDPDMVQRMNQLETETQQLRAELDRFRQQQQPKRLPSVDQQGYSPADVSVAPAPVLGTSDDTPPLPTSAYPTSYAPEGQAGADYYSLEELKGEMKKLVWKKGEFSITPYGILWANGVYETERSTVGDYTLWVNSAQDGGQPTFHADGKNTRLGVDVLGPKLPCFYNAQTGGKVEVDFQGSFVTENKGSLLLRHAYAEVKNEDFRLLAGQTWDVVSPLFPTCVLYSVYWDAGNIGYRRPQFRGERFLAFSDTFLLTLQGSLNADVITDTAPTGITATGDHSSWPVVEGRAAITLGERGKGCLPWTFGVSSHVGEQDFRFAGPVIDHARTWSLNADFKVPINRYFGFQGEVYTGENLGTFLGGIGQGYNFTLRESIYDQGGWIEGYYYWTDRLHSHVGYCLDDPLDSDLSAASSRIYNQVFFGNFIYDITKQFQLGLEVGSWKTLYLNQTPGESIRTEFMVKYGF
jgi:hypothetical protein